MMMMMMIDDDWHEALVHLQPAVIDSTVVIIPGGEENRRNKSGNRSGNESGKKSWYESGNSLGNRTDISQELSQETCKDISKDLSVYFWRKTVWTEWGITSQLTRSTCWRGWWKRASPSRSQYSKHSRVATSLPPTSNPPLPQDWPVKQTDLFSGLRQTC